MSQVSTIPTAEEHEVMAAAVNAVLVRCQQVGRAHMTPQDARVATTVAKAIMSIGPAENVVTLGAPQTQPKLAEIVGMSAVESAIANVAPATFGPQPPAIAEKVA